MAAMLPEMMSFLGLLWCLLPQCAPPLTTRHIERRQPVSLAKDSYHLERPWTSRAGWSRAVRIPLAIGKANITQHFSWARLGSTNRTCTNLVYPQNSRHALTGTFWDAQQWSTLPLDSPDCLQDNTLLQAQWHDTYCSSATHLCEMLPYWTL